MIFSILLLALFVIGGLFAFQQGDSVTGMGALGLGVLLAVLMVVSLGKRRVPDTATTGGTGGHAIGGAVALFFIVVMLLVLTGNIDAARQVYTLPVQIFGPLVSPMSQGVR